MEKLIFFLITLLLSDYSASGSYSKSFLWKLISESEIIVSGEIVEVNNDSYKIAINEKVKGEFQKDTLVIQKFENWTCAKRYADYKVHQKGIYFLKLINGKYETIGAANEGEIIVIDNNVYIEEDSYEDTFPITKNANISNYIKFTVFDYVTVINGINDYLENQDKIDKEFDNIFSRTIIYQNSYIDKPFKNRFLQLVLNQRKDYNVYNLR